MKALSPVIEAHDFAPGNFIGGEAALDFVNTVTGRDQTPRDWLDSYARLLEWAEKSQLLPQRALRALTKMSQAQPIEAARDQYLIGHLFPISLSAVALPGEMGSRCVDPQRVFTVFAA